MNNLNHKMTSFGVFRLDNDDSEFVGFASIDPDFPDTYSFYLGETKIYVLPLDVPYFFGQFGILGKHGKNRPWLPLGHGRMSDDGEGIHISFYDTDAKLFITKN